MLTRDGNPTGSESPCFSTIPIQKGSYCLWLSNLRCGGPWSFHGGHSHSVQCLAAGSPRKVLSRTLDGTLKGAGIRATGRCAWVGAMAFYRSLSYLLWRSLGNPAVGQAGWCGTPGCSPPSSCSVSSDFLLCPPRPHTPPSLLPLGRGSLARLGSNRQTLQKIFFNFPNFSRCQEGARKTLQLQSGLGERTCSKAFPPPPPW